jgi:hypothetical protein
MNLKQEPTQDNVSPGERDSLIKFLVGFLYAPPLHMAVARDVLPQEKSQMPHRISYRPSIAELNADFEQQDWAAIDRQINKDTANWKRAQALFGIPRPLEVRAQISASLKGRRLSEETKQRISLAIRAHHERVKRTIEMRPGGASRKAKG